MTTCENFESSNWPVLDAQAVIRDMDNDAAGYREVAIIFLEEVDPTLQSLAAQAGQGLSALVPILHEAANSMSIIGARRGANLVRQMEGDIYEGATPETAEAVELCSLCLVRTALALREFLDQQP